MRTAALEDEESESAAGNALARKHPPFRRFVAASMAFVFALTLAAAGLLLCAS
jgi:hypothetical protein